jgi:ABC-2 type transport system ATP-binding protein
VIVLSGGRIVADTTPHELRTRGGPPTIRYSIPDGAPLGDLPAVLTAHLDGDGRTLVVRDSDVASALRELVGWADRHSLDLSALEVGPPSLEEAYLTAIGEPLSPVVSSHD